MQKFSELPDIKFPKPTEAGVIQDASGKTLGTLGLFKDDKCYTRGDNNCFAYAFATSMFLKIATLSNKEESKNFVNKFQEKFPKNFTLDFQEKILKGEISKEDATFDVLKTEFNDVLEKFKEYLEKKPAHAALYIHKQMMQNQKFSLAIAAMVKQITLDELKLNKKNTMGQRYFDAVAGDSDDDEEGKYQNLYSYIQDYRIIGKLDTSGELHRIFREKMDFLDYNIKNIEGYRDDNNQSKKLIFDIDFKPGHFSAALPADKDIEDKSVVLPKADDDRVIADSAQEFEWKSNEIKFRGKDLNTLAFVLEDGKIVMTDLCDKKTKVETEIDKNQLLEALRYAGRDKDVKKLFKNIETQLYIQKEQENQSAHPIVKYINDYCYPNNIIDSLPKAIQIGTQSKDVVQEQDLASEQPKKIDSFETLNENDDIILTFEGTGDTGAFDKAANFFKEYKEHKEHNDVDELQFAYCEEQNMFYCFRQGDSIPIAPEIAENVIGEYFKLTEDNAKKKYASNLGEKITELKSKVASTSYL